MALFIVNPAAGHGSAAKFWRRIQPLVQNHFGRHEIAWTAGPKHASELAAKALEKGERRIIAVGGDGSFREVVEGWFLASPKAREGAAIGVLSAGSGCDFARHFGIPKDARRWIPRLAAAEPRAVDAGEASYLGFDGRPVKGHFANIAMLGLAGEIGVAMLKSGKPFGGTLSYLAESIKAISKATAKRLHLRIDDRKLDGEFHMVAVANTSTTGGGMKIAPKADASDGRFDLVSVGAIRRPTLLRHFPKIYRGTHLGVEGVEVGHVKRFEAHSPDEVFLNIDGEAGGRLPAVFTVLPKALSVLLP
jgi:YegS/Rv2252/BmrU family lipid kinase